VASDNDILAAILQKLADIEKKMAVHTEHHVAMSRRCEDHSTKITGMAGTLYGNGRRGLITIVAVHSWAIGLSSFVAGSCITALAMKVF